MGRDAPHEHLPPASRVIPKGNVTIHRLSEFGAHSCIPAVAMSTLAQLLSPKVNCAPLGRGAPCEGKYPPGLSCACTR